MRKYLPWIIIGGVILMLVFWVISSKNQALRYNQAVNKEWGNVDASYQRRNDLIQNLVNTVKGYATHEQSTLTAVIAARNTASNMKIDPATMTPEQIQAYSQAQSNVSNAMRGLQLNVIVERYPDLKANQGFLKLQDELASTENQILTARTRFNESVEIYNGYVLASPRNLFLGSYRERPYFKSVEGADRPVEVKF
jgi:LemA protein